CNRESPHRARKPALLQTPLPDPPPQGGRERPAAIPSALEGEGREGGDSSPSPRGERTKRRAPLAPLPLWEREGPAAQRREGEGSSTQIVLPGAGRATTLRVAQRPPAITLR